MPTSEAMRFSGFPLRQCSWTYWRTRDFRSSEFVMSVFAPGDWDFQRGVGLVGWTAEAATYILRGEAPHLIDAIRG
jgi:hypothetical protein